MKWYSHFVLLNTNSCRLSTDKLLPPETDGNSGRNGGHHSPSPGDGGWTGQPDSDWIHHRKHHQARNGRHALQMDPQGHQPKIYTVSACIQIYTFSAYIHTVSACIQIYTVSACIQLHTVSACIQIYTVSACIQLYTVSACIQLYTVSAHIHSIQLVLISKSIQLMLISNSTVCAYIQLYTVSACLEIYINLLVSVQGNSLSV